MKAVHQFLPTFEPGAIGSDALAVQKALRAAGYESEIFAEYIRPPYEELAYEHARYAARALKDDLLIYHMALGSNVSDWLTDRKEKLMLRHHNITPVEYYSPWPDANTYGMAWGRHQLRDLAKRVTIGCGVSEFNRRELEDLHYKQTAVTPLLLDFGQFDRGVDEAELASLQAAKTAGGADWLFVGWIAPHKCQHDIITAFSLYRKLYDPNARLHLVGRPALDSYWIACEKLISELGLQNAVFMPGRVTDGELGAYYKTADVLVSMSEHEGVGIPLLEAMHNSVPVIAYSAAAIPETVGDAGVLLTRKRPAYVAAAVDRVVKDASLRMLLTARARARLKQFSVESATEKLLAVVSRQASAEHSGP